MFDLMSTPEGQSMFTDGAEGRYPATRKADGELHAPLLSDYRNVVDRNNLVELAAYTAPLLLGGEALGGYIAGTVSAEEALQACDEAMKSNKSETQIGDVVAHIERDLRRPSDTSPTRSGSTGAPTCALCCLAAWQTGKCILMGFPASCTKGSCTPMS